MNPGRLAAISAYVLWGFIPLFWKQLTHVDPYELVCHRVIWSFLALAIATQLFKDRILNSQALKSPTPAEHTTIQPTALKKHRYLWCIAASILIAVNWLIFVWAMKNNRVVESSLGYFINPLMSVALGVIFFSEKLPRLQWIAIAFAAMGVGYITYQLGAVPWLALTLAGSFALYGIVKKQMPLPALMGLWLETAVLIVPATMFIAWKWYYGTGGFGNFGLATDLLIVSTGPVTTIPLLLFAIGAKSIPLSQMGFLQYIAPSLQFLIGWIVYHEAVDVNRWIGFACVWTGLAIFVMTQRRGQ